jgi:hypothetical protein
MIAAHRAFERGDFAAARRLARALRDGAQDPATRQAADALLDRLKLDPLIVWLTAGCAVLFIAVVALTFAR